MYGFKGIRQTFNIIVGLLLFLFGLSYVQLGGFVGKMSKNAAEAQSAAHIDLHIRWLGEQFWTLRFWEQVVQTQRHPEADRQFGITLERIRTQLKDIDLAGHLAENVTQISSLLTQYEDSFNRLMQFRTEQRLNQTQIKSNYQVLSSTILLSQDLELLKPLLNLNRFLDRYLSTRKDSELKALRMVFVFLQAKLADAEIMDERLRSYVVKFDQLIERDFMLEQEIREINARFDNISQSLMELFLRNSRNAAVLSQKATAQAETLQKQIQWQLFVFSGVAFIILLFIISLIRRKIINPIHQLSSLVTQVKAGNSERRFVSEEKGEIAELGFAVNEMLDTIRRHHERLEALVEERTEELIDTNAQLQQEIAKHQQTERQLHEAKESAEVANKAKSTFLANMSHELRTPLNAIIGFAQVMGHSRSLTQEQHENLRIIHENGDHLLTLINQVLDLSKIEAGHLELHSGNLDLYELLDELEETFQLKAKTKGLKMSLERHPELPRYIEGDEIRLRQVLLNLLSNAMKFTERGSVSLKVHYAQLPEFNRQSELSLQESAIAGQGPTAGSLPPTASSLLSFEVIDTGPGIAPDEQMHLFEAFQQTRTGLKLPGGTGLGLSICRKFVQLMGGEISVKSSVGRGANFTFSIPVSEVNVDYMEKTTPERRAIGLQPEQPAFRILVVDDKLNNRQLLVTLLTPLGFTVREAMNGEEAIRSWEDWKPHAILMDMRMPTVDGYDATRKIRELEAREQEQEAGSRTIIFAVTALSLADEEKSALAAGCDDFLRKPFHEAEVFSLLHKHLGVQFIYEEPEIHEECVENRPLQEDMLLEKLAALPLNLLERLKRATIIADTKELLSVIQDIRHYNEPIAERLLSFTENYEYTEILQIIQRSELKEGDVS